MRARGDTRRSEGDIRERLADALVRRREDIQERWLDRITRDVSVSGVDPTELTDAMPDYLLRLAESLRAGGSLEERGTEAWRGLAREHALTRVRLGFDIRELMHEFIVLRQVVFEIAREEGLISASYEADRMADLVEAGMAESVRAYVESRDYGARRKEAEHVGFITHELRNPLTTAILVAGRIRKRGSLGAQDARALELLERSLRRLETLISNVLTVERLEAGEVTARSTQLTMGEVIEPALASARVAAESKGLELVARFDPAAPVHADRELAASALQNLLDNAIKFTDAGRVELDVDVEGDDAVLHVRDSCPGISPRELRDIFEPFRRGHGHERVAGTGLGLAIARRAVEAQGGTIDVESAPGRGCHFWFTLPRTAAARAARPPEEVDDCDGPDPER